MPKLSIVALVLVVLVAMLPLAVSAEVWNNNSVSVTGTSSTVTFPRPFSSVQFENDSASANNVHYRLFWCGETPAAATTASIRLKVGAVKIYDFNPITEGGSGTYCAASFIAASSGTATVLIDGK